MSYERLHLILGLFTVSILLFAGFQSQGGYEYKSVPWFGACLWAAAIGIVWGTMALAQLLFDARVPLLAAVLAIGWAVIYAGVTVRFYWHYSPSEGLGQLGYQIVCAAAGVVVALIVLGSTFWAHRTALA